MGAVLWRAWGQTPSGSWSHREGEGGTETGRINHALKTGEAGCGGWKESGILKGFSL